MKLTTCLFASTLVTSLAFLTGCQATSQGGRTFTPNQAQTAMQSFHGTILHVAVVQIQHEEKGGGAVVGTLLGGIAGSTVGGGRGTRLATAGGAARLGARTGQRTASPAAATLPVRSTALDLERRISARRRPRPWCLPRKPRGARYAKAGRRRPFRGLQPPQSCRTCRIAWTTAYSQSLEPRPTKRTLLGA